MDAPFKSLQNMYSITHKNLNNIMFDNPEQNERFLDTKNNSKNTQNQKGILNH